VGGSWSHHDSPMSDMLILRYIRYGHLFIELLTILVVIAHSKPERCLFGSQSKYKEPPVLTHFLTMDKQSSSVTAYRPPQTAISDCILRQIAPCLPSSRDNLLYSFVVHSCRRRLFHHLTQRSKSPAENFCARRCNKRCQHQASLSDLHLQNYILAFISSGRLKSFKI
jgi:hypothetical protein